MQETALISLTLYDRYRSSD